MKFSIARPNPGKRSAENFTKISRQISRHLWQRKTEKIFTSALLQGSCSDQMLNLVLGVGVFSLLPNSFPLQKPRCPTPPRPHPTPRNGPETDPKQTQIGKSQRVKTQRVKTSENFAEEKNVRRRYFRRFLRR